MTKTPALAVLLTLPLGAQQLANLDLRGSVATATTYKGSAAIKLVEKNFESPGEAIAVIKNSNFHNGSIEVDVAGTPSAKANSQARGFIGIAFRVQAAPDHFEMFYIRPTNGRAPDQLRRNHSMQYVSSPDWPWERLRKETPGAYESYADLIPGEWTHLRMVVQGTHAELFIGSATQPALIVNDLKLGDSQGGVALWIGPGTEGYFKNLQIRQ
jgi:hypothetical protein